MLQTNMLEGDITYRIPEGEGQGYLTVNRPTLTQPAWELVDIDVVPQRQGLGSKLIRMFLADHPPGTLVHGHISHEESTDLNSGLQKNPERTTITEMEVIYSIPIFRFLRSSGITIHRVEVIYDESFNDPQFLMSYHGETR